MATTAARFAIAVRFVGVVARLAEVSSSAEVPIATQARIEANLPFAPDLGWSRPSSAVEQPALVWITTILTLPPIELASVALPQVDVLHALHCDHRRVRRAELQRRFGPLELRAVPRNVAEPRRAIFEDWDPMTRRDGWVGVALDLELQKRVIRVAAKHHLAKQRRVRRNCSTRGLT